MDCRDRKTGSRCYRRIGFRRHHLLGLVPQAEANQAGSERRQQQWPWRKAAKGGQVQPFVMSGWAVSGQTPPGATAPATKWHLRMNRKGSSPMYLNVELDPMRKRSTITHEAAVRIGMSHSTCFLQGRRMARSETSWRLEPTPWSERIGGDQRTWQAKDPTS